MRALLLVLVWLAPPLCLARCGPPGNPAPPTSATASSMPIPPPPTASASAPEPPPVEIRVASCSYESFHLVEGLVASPPLDYAVEIGETQGRYGHERRVFLEKGTPCKRAKNPAACMKRLKTTQLPSAAECTARPEESCSTGYLAYTRGEEVGFISTREDQRALVGSIDTMEEAKWTLEGVAGNLCIQRHDQIGDEHRFKYFRNCQMILIHARSYFYSVVRRDGSITTTEEPVPPGLEYACEAH